MNIPINIALPQLWGSKTFLKNFWGSINLIVGSNGTGKSLFADQLKVQLMQKGYKVRLLNAERLSGFERQNYQDFNGLVPVSHSFTKGFDISRFDSLKSKADDFGLSSSAFVILKERLDVRVKIEALLSDMFKKTIRLVEAGGFLRPMIQNISGGQEYSLKETECHGLKELLTLLTFIYDDSKNCLVLDEPELHLHPQFQSFLLNEIKSFAGDPTIDPTKKIFFIITHSPYFLDIRNIDDFKSIFVSHHGEPPTFVETLDPQEEYIIKRFLPRFNTHHKQFFFSPNPVFVEGYTDQQLITLLFDRLDYKISASGSCVIDVGGKDELAVFFNLCKKLKIEGRVIADLDALFRGKLREVIQTDARCVKYIQDNGIGTDMSILIGELERKLKDIADDLVTKTSLDSDVLHIISYLNGIISIVDKRNDVIVSMLLAVQRYKDKIARTVSAGMQGTINFVLPRFEQLLNASKMANVFIIPKGELEHYYTQTSIDYLNFNDSLKNTSFHTERDYILSESNLGNLQENYGNLMSVLKESVPQIKVDLSKHVKFQLIEWIQKVQNAIAKGEVVDLSTLMTHAKVDYALFNQILEVKNVEVKEDRKFKCEIQIKPSLSGMPKEITFDERTVAHEFELVF